MRRQERVGLHKKQERPSIKNGIPLVNELIEGVPAFRNTPEGLVQYVRHGNRMYKNIFQDTSGEKSSEISIQSKSDHFHTVSWIDMVLENAWFNYSNNYITPSYCKDVNGFVHLRGLIAHTPAGTTSTQDITSLPTGYRPSKRIILVGLTSGGHQCRVNIREDGDVFGSGTVVGNGAMSTNWVSLYGLLFYAG